MSQREFRMPKYRSDFLTGFDSEEKGTTLKTGSFKSEHFVLVKMRDNAANVVTVVLVVYRGEARW